MYYQRLITELTGITDEHNLWLIEDCMREDIFHSTLDWQTREEFEEGVNKAVAMLSDDIV
jgi:hypothetical protein